MVSRDDVLKYGALLLIVVFVGETIFLGLSNNNSSSSTESSPSPTPVSFTASVNTSGVITQLGFLGLAACSSNSGMDVSLKNQSGVSNALFASNDVLAFRFNANASLPALESLIVRGCQSPLFRSASLKLPPALAFNSPHGMQYVPSRVLDQFFVNQGGPGFQAFVSPAWRVNDSVNVSIFLAVQNDRLVSVNAQEPELEVLAHWIIPLPSVIPKSSGNQSLQNQSVNGTFGNQSAIFGNSSNNFTR